MTGGTFADIDDGRTRAVTKDDIDYAARCIRRFARDDAEVAEFTAALGIEGAAA